MKSFSENLVKYIWFTGGLFLGLTFISLGQASVPTRATPPVAKASGSLMSEMRGGKVNSPELDQDFEKVNTLEGKYAESWDQQQRLRSATSRVAGSKIAIKKKAKR